MSSNYIATKDGVDIFYKDWGPKDAQPIMFHHGWPLSSANRNSSPIPMFGQQPFRKAAVQIS